MLDIINSKDLDLAPPQCIQLPHPVTKDPKSNNGPAMFKGEKMADQTLATVNYNDNVELALQLNKNISEAKALKPTSLTEAECHLNWL